MNNTEVENGIKSILSQTIDNRQMAYRQLVGLLDLTTLEGTDNKEVVEKLCDRALSVINDEKSIPSVAAVCVYPNFANAAKLKLQGTSIHVACVAGAFPSGQSPLSIRLAEVEDAVSNGADEIDMVISRGRFLAGDEDFLAHEVKAHKRACGEAHLKVILETGELKDFNLIYRASMISMENGADFIKTSTGKVQPAATLEAAYVMLNAINDFHLKSGKKIGFKPAGGIGEAEIALQYYQLVKQILGEEWLNKDLFRIGASRLLKNLLDIIE